jgi:hypothetical protein
MHIAQNSIIPRIAVISDARNLEDICESNIYNTCISCIVCIVCIRCSGSFCNLRELCLL